jgi:Protein of unknown function (DUF2851)
MATGFNHVAEMQGLYGPFTMAERVVQKIWLRGDFDRSRAVLADGRTLAVRSTGAWNLLGGPDFRDARLVIDGREITGDVEVHFHVADWRAHGHEADRAYDHVALHVVLFPPGAGEPAARRGDGREIPALVLLPLLHRDLEEYASDDALEAITARDEWQHLAELAAWPAAELQELLQAKARERWRQKVHFAKLRIARLGWPAAAHQTALEILGYRRNRAAMLALAARFPLEAWNQGAEPPGIFTAGGAPWQLQGVRPANHPRTRLQQYRQWVTASPDWPDRLLRLMDRWPESGSITTPTRLARLSFDLKKRRQSLAADLVAGAVGGTRLDNLACDGFLPLRAARTGQDCLGLWFHWFLGDVPAQVRRTLPKLGVTTGRLQPLCHGYAQGLLGWFLEREARASA